MVGHRDHLIRNMAVVLGLFEVLSELRIACGIIGFKEIRKDEKERERERGRWEESA